MINNTKELYDLVFDIVHGASGLPESNIFFVNQNTHYPSKEPFIVLKVDLSSSGLTKIRNENGVMVHKCNIVCDVYNNQLLASKLRNIYRYYDFSKHSEVQAVTRGNQVLNLTELDAGVFLERHNTNFAIHVLILQSAEIAPIAKKIGDIKIENQSNNRS